MGFIGNRLEAGLNLLKNTGGAELFADIGSDHAFFAIEALKRGLAKRAVAADINKEPLIRGREFAEKQGVKAEFVLSDGFEKLEDMPIGVAAICGMGGELIVSIIQKSNVAKKCSLILQPMSAQEKLRFYLWRNGFEIVVEQYAIESGRPYTIMLVKNRGVTEEYSYADLFLGKTRPETAEFKAYAAKVLSRAEKRLKGELAEGADTTATKLLISECQTHTTSL